MSICVGVVLLLLLFAVSNLSSFLLRMMRIVCHSDKRQVYFACSLWGFDVGAKNHISLCNAHMCKQMKSQRFKMVQFYTVAFRRMRTGITISEKFLRVSFMNENHFQYEFVQEWENITEFYSFLFFD